jgi:hypothetical protein
MRISWENWNDIYNEVIDPLAQEGADIFCDVNILTQRDSTIRDKPHPLAGADGQGEGVGRPCLCQPPGFRTR